MGAQLNLKCNINLSHYVIKTHKYDQKGGFTVIDGHRHVLITCQRGQSITGMSCVRCFRVCVCSLIGDKNSILKLREEHGVAYQRSFPGCQLIDWLLQNGEAESRRRGLELCRALQEHGIIRHGEGLLPLGVEVWWVASSVYSKYSHQLFIEHLINYCPIVYVLSLSFSHQQWERSTTSLTVGCSISSASIFAAAAAYLSCLMKASKTLTKVWQCRHKRTTTQRVHLFYAKVDLRGATALFSLVKENVAFFCAFSTFL